MGGPAVEPLIRALGSENARARRAAASALGEIGDSRAAKPLMQLFQGGDEEVGRETVSAIVRLNDSGTIDQMIQILLDGWKNSEIRIEAAWALGELGDSKGRAALLEALEDNNMLKMRA